MNTGQTSKNIFMYIKTHYGETILAKIRKLEKTMIHLILIIYDFLFAVITARFYRKTYNYKVESRLNEVIKMARWWEKYLSKRSPLKRTCSWHDRLWLSLHFRFFKFDIFCWKFITQLLSIKTNLPLNFQLKSV